MKQEWMVLHITDFHISDSASQQEHLRENFFREYLDDLTKVIKEHDVIGPKAIDVIVITGDFINHGNLGGLAHVKFEHAKKVIAYLCEKLGIEKRSVFVCNGNHDIDRDLEMSGKLADARNEFTLFSGEYGNGPVANSLCRSKLVKTTYGAYALLLDSTINAGGKNRPGSITEIETDEIMDQVRMAEIKDGELLLVAAHYPTCPFVAADAPFDDLNQDWNAEHMWLSAHPIYKRLKKTSNVPILWLSGDIHRHDYIIEKPIHTVVTGRLGAASGAIATQVRRQARLVVMTSNGESRSWLCEFVPSGHRDVVLRKIHMLSTSLSLYQHQLRHPCRKIRISRVSSYHLNAPQLNCCRANYRGQLLVQLHTKNCIPWVDSQHPRLKLRWHGYQWVHYWIKASYSPHLLLKWQKKLRRS
jgi:hypothetical protein